MNMLTNEYLRLHFRIEGQRLSLIKTTRTNTSPPAGEKNPFKPVSNSIIGHWLEIKGKHGQILYRRFLQKLPLQVQTTTRTSKRRKGTEITSTYDIVVPATDGDCKLFIYEQSLPCPKVKQTRRQIHFTINLNEHANLETAC